MPISWILTGSRAVSGRAEEGLLELLVERVFLERSSRDGLGRELGMVGEPGSFFTTIFGGPFAIRGLDGKQVSMRQGKAKGRSEAGIDVR